MKKSISRCALSPAPRSLNQWMLRRPSGHRRRRRPSSRRSRRNRRGRLRCARARPPLRPPKLSFAPALSIAIGAGYRFPTSLTTPNITSVRLRLPSGLTFEPALVFASSSHTVDNGSAVSRVASEAGVSVLARFPLVQKKRTDLELLGGAGFDYLGEDPDDQNSDDVTTTTSLSLRYGVGVGYWITPHVHASMSATNSLVTYTKKREEMGAGSVLVTMDTTVGLIFNPTVAFMIHLYN